MKILNVKSRIRQKKCNRIKIKPEQTGENIKKQILKHANGYNKTRKLLEDFKITIDIDYNKISTGTIDIRNKVIHGGYFPTREEVVQAIKDAKLVIREHNVQIFSDKTP